MSKVRDKKQILAAMLDRKEKADKVISVANKNLSDEKMKKNKLLEQSKSKNNEKKGNNALGNNKKVEMNKVTSKMQSKFVDKLSGAEFRWLNEKLYTTKSNDAVKLYQETPELFNRYHDGFRKQVESWPINPLDLIIQKCRKIVEGSVSKVCIGDFGCGDARLAHTLGSISEVHSFDLVSVNACVTACDIAHTPLKDGQLDVAVFCLALMGTNFEEFLVEAGRCLKENATLFISEVQSRFSNILKFIEKLNDIGFKLVEKNDYKFFTSFEFQKQRTTTDHKKKRKVLETDSEVLLKACKYKKR